MDRARWDARHAGAPVPAPPSALVDRLDLLPASGRALDVACGTGGVALWLAERGLSVDAVDVSPVGLALGAAASSAVCWHLADLDDGLPVTGPYDVVVCQRFWDPRLALASLLAPGGLLVMTVLTTGAFGAPRGALLEVCAGLSVLHHEHGEREASVVARRS